jgi:uncharacterized protein YuzE
MPTSRMTTTFLQVTYRSGRPLAAYLYISRQDGDRVARTEDAGDGMVVDFGADGRVIGVEIFAPTRFVLNNLNRVLGRFGCEPVAKADVAPIAAA